LLDPTTIDAELVVDWGTGTASPFVTFDGTAIDLDAKNTSIGVRHQIQVGAQSFDVKGMSSDPLIAPNPTSSNTVFTIGHAASSTTENFNTYGAFITQLQSELNGIIAEIEAIRDGKPLQGTLPLDGATNGTSGHAVDPKLAVLKLWITGVTDSGMRELAALKSLKHLELGSKAGRSRVRRQSRQGAARFLRLHPRSRPAGCILQTDLRGGATGRLGPDHHLWRSGEATGRRAGSGARCRPGDGQKPGGADHPLPQGSRRGRQGRRLFRTRRRDG